MAECVVGDARSVSPIQRPARAEVLVFDDAADLRSWLEANHATAAEAWIGYYRKGTGKRSATHAEAVEEALCFGWIDGIGYRVDDEVSANRYTPRRDGSYWSAVNIGKVERLMAEGRMAPSGLAAFERRDASAEARYSYENRPANLPPEMLSRLRADDAARTYWDGQTPSYRRAATFWVISAKQEATRQRRLEQLIADSAAGRPIKLLSYGRASPRGRSRARSS